jgi:hypothetical protein
VVVAAPARRRQAPEDVVPHGLLGEAELAQRPWPDRLGVVPEPRQPEDEVLAADPPVPEVRRLLMGRDDHRPCFFRQPLEHRASAALHQAVRAYRRWLEKPTVLAAEWRNRRSGALRDVSGAVLWNSPRFFI